MTDNEFEATNNMINNKCDWLTASKVANDE